MLRKKQRTNFRETQVESEGCRETLSSRHRRPPSLSAGIDEYIARRLASTWGRADSQPQHSVGDLCPLHKLIETIPDENVPSSVSSEELWSPVLERIRSHPEEVPQCDRRGRTCLSAACTKRYCFPPDEVIRAFLQKGRYRIASSRDKNGKTALVIALQSGAPQRILRLLCSDLNAALVETRDHRGDVALHVACSTRYFAEDREDLVRMLVQASPRAVSFSNNKGKTPLHTAFESNASIEVIQTLVEACPDALVKDDCGYTPLVTAIRERFPFPLLKLLVQTNPGCTRMKDEGGYYPLQRALSYGLTSLEHIRLLCTDPQVVLATDSCGSNTLSVALLLSPPSSVDQKVIEFMLQMAPNAVRAANKSDVVQICNKRYLQARREAEEGRPSVRTLAAGERQKWLNITRIVLEHAVPEEEGSLLRTAILSKVSADLIQVIVGTQPAELEMTDRRGRSALHLACTGLYPAGREKDATLHLILNVRPALATTLDNDGCYALHLACEHGGISLSVLRRLICSNAEALNHIDGKHRLYPFLLAALPRSGDVPDEDTIVIGSIFELLSAQPNVLRACFP